MFDQTFVAVMLAAVAACGVTTLGIHLVSRRERWARSHSIHFISFAAGMLLSVTVLHLVPEALATGGAAAWLILAGFLAIYLLNRLLHLYFGESRKEAPLGLIPMLGIGLHSFIDGWIYSVTFSVEIFTGVLAAIGMILHELPEGIIVYVALQRGRYQGRRAWWYAFLAAAVTTPAGALISYPVAGLVSEAALGGMLALSAGVLLYVAAAHLLPQVERENRPVSTLFFGAGVLLAVTIILLAH
ncbi:MAG: ZIP family metal transporter [Planctomycetota bacterium]